MSTSIITVDGLGKKYRIRRQQLGQSYVALRDVLAAALMSPKRWGSKTTRTRAASQEEFWALQDVSFEVEVGDVVGVIGRNGAGKSTLLKVLSRITEPTSGRVTLGGRVASLLEIGTGFHPELTGRENVFLNGAILGMSRAEIKRKFDEIVAFAEVEQFLDTPVKRYSSGMHVRLGFAVAAHLEPEILIVDEVLAVGDAAFQKKCLNKMRDVSAHGRTVLFVSHNMAAVQALCGRGMLLERGRLVFAGGSGEAVRRYLASDPCINAEVPDRVLSDSLRLTRLQSRPVVTERGAAISFTLILEASTADVISDLALLIDGPSGERAALIDLRSPEGPFRLDRRTQLVIHVHVLDLPLVENDFSLGMYLSADSVCDSFMNLQTFAVPPMPQSTHAGGVVPREAQFRGLVELRANIRHQVMALDQIAPASELVEQ